MGPGGSGICANARPVLECDLWRGRGPQGDVPANHNSKGHPHERRHPRRAQPRRCRPGTGRLPIGRPAPKDGRGRCPRIFQPRRPRRPGRTHPRRPAGRAADPPAPGRSARERPAQGAHLLAHPRRRRLDVASHRHPDRQRRHALPGGFHEPGNPSTGPDAAPGRAPDLRRRTRRQGQAQVHRRQRQWPLAHRAARVVDAHRGRSPGGHGPAGRTGRRPRAGAGRRARGGDRLARHAGAPERSHP